MHDMSNRLIVTAPRVTMNQNALFQVLKVSYQDDEKKKVVLLIPASVRFRVLAMGNIQLEAGTASMRAVMSLSFFMAGLSRATVDRISENLKMQINQGEIINLNPEGNPAISRSFVRKYGVLNLSCEYNWPIPVTVTKVTSAPYNKLVLKHFCDLKLIMWRWNGHPVLVKFNIIDGATSDLFKLPPKDNQDEDEYDFDRGTVRIHYNIPCENLRVAGTDFKKEIINESEALKMPEFLIQRIEPIPGKQNVRDRITLNWQTISFSFEMYRHPIPTLLIISLPVLLLTILAIAIYFQQKVGFSTIIAQIATLMITFTTYLPYVREKIIKTYRVTKIDLMLVTVLIINLLTLIHYFIDYRRDAQSYDWKKDPFVLITLSLFFLILVVILISIIVHLIRLKTKYLVDKDCPSNKRERDNYTSTCLNVIKTYLEYQEEGYEAGFIDQRAQMDFVEELSPKGNNLPLAAGYVVRTQPTVASIDKTVITTQEYLRPSQPLIPSPRQYSQLSQQYFPQPLRPQNNNMLPTSAQLLPRYP